jgi:hypothetical protein
LFPNANSRGQVYVIDETAKTATALVNADLGVYSVAVGSAQLLSNGNYFSLSGILPIGLQSQAAEIQAHRSQTWALNASTSVYRAFRLNSLYGQ